MLGVLGHEVGDRRLIGGRPCHTETRVVATDNPSRRKMSAYWLLIGQVAA
jgi:hypothetical protein